MTASQSSLLCQWIMEGAPACPKQCSTSSTAIATAVAVAVSLTDLLCLWNHAGQVLANFPFNIMGSLCTVWTLYGMAGLRPGWEHVMKAGTLASLLYLVALQVG
jgi:hypothetical protein